MADSLDPPIAEQAETKLRCSAKPRLQTPAKRKLQVRAAPWNCPPPRTLAHNLGVSVWIQDHWP
jgi:hypothetical protein